MLPQAFLSLFLSLQILGRFCQQICSARKEHKSLAVLTIPPVLTNLLSKFCKTVDMVHFTFDMPSSTKQSHSFSQLFKLLQMAFISSKCWWTCIVHCSCNFQQCTFLALILQSLVFLLKIFSEILNCVFCYSRHRDDTSFLYAVSKF